MKQSSNTILTTKTKYPYIRPCTEVILLDLSGALNEPHVSAVNIKGFDKGEVPTSQSMKAMMMNRQMPSIRYGMTMSRTHGFSCPAFRCMGGSG